MHQSAGGVFEHRVVLRDTAAHHRGNLLEPMLIAGDQIHLPGGDNPRATVGIHGPRAAMRQHIAVAHHAAQRLHRALGLKHGQRQVNRGVEVGIVVVGVVAIVKMAVGDVVARHVVDGVKQILARHVLRQAMDAVAALPRTPAVITDMRLGSALNRVEALHGKRRLEVVRRACGHHDVALNHAVARHGELFVLRHHVLVHAALAARRQLRGQAAEQHNAERDA